MFCENSKGDTQETKTAGGGKSWVVFLTHTRIYAPGMQTHTTCTHTHTLIHTPVHQPITFFFFFLGATARGFCFSFQSVCIKKQILFACLIPPFPNGYHPSDSPALGDTSWKPCFPLSLCCPVLRCWEGPLVPVFHLAPFCCDMRVPNTRTCCRTCSQK